MDGRGAANTNEGIGYGGGKKRMIAAEFFKPVLTSDQAGSEPALIDVHDVTMRFPVPKRYREWVLAPLQRRRVFTALSDVNLRVYPGDRIAVMGPNGAGKTTLLKLIGGILLPSEGSVVVNGHSTLSEGVEIRRSVGFVFNEERSFFWRLSGAQNLEFFGALDNLCGRELRERVEFLLDLVGLQNDKNRSVSTYSSGMKQRLALARVLIAEPDVLVLDEPTRALDPLACDEMVELILSTLHRNSKKTLLIATHRPEEASLLCNKVLIVAEGKIKCGESINKLREEGLSVLDYYRLHLSGRSHV
ncbi:MAG: ABC transporter ATP-binding protein [Acidobacteria bacterium]|nr:ABC transporter ATP-binding protein [Acidobacteriota bacterium]